MADLKYTKRDRLAIQRDILVAAKGGANKTQIVYQSNLNFMSLKHHLKELIDRGFLTDPSDGIYFATPEGLSFARRYTKLEA